MSRIKLQGFTIVELAVVITVMAILATVVAVSYSGFQERARDTQRTSDVDTIADALKVYYSKNKPDTNCGAVTNLTWGNTSQPGFGHTMSGFFSADPDGGGTQKSIEQCLIDGKYIDGPIRDPTGTVSCSGTSRSCRAYFVATCFTGAQYKTYVYANLETGDQTSTNLTDNTCQIAATYDSTFGMNYVSQVQ